MTMMMIDNDHNSDEEDLVEIEMLRDIIF